MMKPKKRIFILTAMIVCATMLPPLSTFLRVMPVNAAGNPVLSFSPAQNVVNFPQPATVNVTLSNVANLESWQIRVAFNASMLSYSNISIPSDDLLGPSGGWLNQVPLVVNGTGYVIIFLSLDVGQVVNGSGTLCQITFNVVHQGMSQLTFANLGVPGPNGGTVLLDGNGNQISFNVINGNVQATSGPIANFNWIPTIPSANVTTFFTSTSSPGWSSSISGYAPITSYTWNFGDGNVTSTSKSTVQHVYSQTGNYTATLTVTDSLSRFNTTSQLIQVIIRNKPWDLDGDGRMTDMKDVAIVAKAFGSRPGSSNWNPIADVSGATPGVPDGVIDMRDVALVTKHFGQTE